VTTTGERIAALAELVRLPAVLTVPGDALAGAALAGAPARAGLVGASAALYLGGMALNDWADRDVDAVERPGRPIPSGRVTPAAALGVAAGLTALGLGLAARAGGRRGLATAAATAAAAWTYDLAATSTPAGPWTMAAARGLDVLLGAAASAGAGQGIGGAAAGAAVVGLHTVVVTRLSAHEVGGAGAGAGAQALAGTAAVVAAAGGLVARRAADPVARGAALGLLAAYAAAVGVPQARARAQGDAAAVRRAVGAGVLGLVLLEAALVAAAGRPASAAAIAACWPVARTLSRRRPVT